MQDAKEGRRVATRTGADRTVVNGFFNGRDAKTQSKRGAVLDGGVVSRTAMASQAAACSCAGARVDPARDRALLVVPREEAGALPDEGGVV